MFPVSPGIHSAEETFASQGKHVKIGDFDGHVSEEKFAKMMKLVEED